MKFLSRTASVLPVLFLALPASGHEAGTVHDLGVSYFLLLAVLGSGIATMLRR